MSRATLQRLKAVFSLFLLLSFSGCVISPRRGTSSSSSTTGTGQLYIANQSANAILRFRGATALIGNIAPVANISGASTQLSAPAYIFLDVTNNRLYVANSNGGDILVFNNVSTLNGNFAPSRIITSTNLVTPVDVTLDSGRDLLYVADNLEVAVFAHASTANGPTSAIRVILPGFTPGAIFLDASNDRLFVADFNANAIDVFDKASTLNGSVSPTRSISGASTQLSQPDGLVIDGAGRLIVSNFFPPSITIYPNAATINGTTVSPVAVISGTNTTLASPAQLTIDPTTNSGELYVSDPTGGHVPVFTSITTVTGTQNLAPKRSLAGANTLLPSAGATIAKMGIALDTMR